METSINTPQMNIKPHQKSKFTIDEDRKLISLVNQFGENNWGSIALYMNGRNIRQCRERWKHYLSPEVSNSPWTEMEDILLHQKYAEYGPKWKKIAEFFPNRTYINIKNRFLLKKRHDERISSQIVEISSELAKKMSNPKRKCILPYQKCKSEKMQVGNKNFNIDYNKTPNININNTLNCNNIKYEFIIPSIKSQTIEMETPDDQDDNFDDFLAESAILTGNADDCYFGF